MDKSKNKEAVEEVDERGSHGADRRKTPVKWGIAVGVTVLTLAVLWMLSRALERDIAPPENVREWVAENYPAAGDQESMAVYTPEEQARLEQRQSQREAARQQAEQKKEEEERAAQEAILEAQNQAWSPEGTPSTVEGAFGILYEQIFEPEGDTYECYYTAKGNLYMLLSPGTVLLEGESQERDTQRTLVFDRESQNGECWLIVYYEEILNADGSEYSTAIRNTYAIKKADGEVIPSGKKAWADVGTAEYQEATGEK